MGLGVLEACIHLRITSMQLIVPHVGPPVYLVWGWPGIGARPYGSDRSYGTLDSPVVHLHDESSAIFPSHSLLLTNPRDIHFDLHQWAFCGAKFTRSLLGDTAEVINTLSRELLLLGAPWRSSYFGRLS